MGSIKIVSDIPGPRSRSVTAAAPAWVARPVAPDPRAVAIARRGAVREQAARFLHTDYSVVPYDLYHRLAEAVSRHCGGERKVAFFNSGAEAVENAGKKIGRASSRG